MIRRMKVRCAECGTWYWHRFNTPYRCPHCGSDVTDDWKTRKHLSKTGVDA